MSLLAQIRSLLPSPRDRQVWWSADTVEAERIAKEVRALHIPSVKYVICLEHLEKRPPDGHPKQAAYDILVSALAEVIDQIEAMPEAGAIAV